MTDKAYSIEPLMEVMDKLLGPDGCPWDKKQDHHTLRRNLLEEAHEVVETIDSDDMVHMKEELGDLLLQVVFHAKIAENDGDFDFNEVVQGIADKLIRRHPHIFGTIGPVDADTVMTNWEQIKLQEKGAGEEASIMSALPPTLPALMQAEKVQNKAHRVGFDWTDVSGAWAKVEEELAELTQAETHEELTDELGDVLFSVVNVARFLEVDAEEALKGSVQKFVRRFQQMEAKAGLDKKPLSSYTIEELEALWRQAKEK